MAYTAVHTGNAIDLSVGYCIEGCTNTILAIAKAMGAGGTISTVNGNVTIAGGTAPRVLVYTKTDSGTSNVSDKPTGSTNAGFTCEFLLNRFNSTSDYRVQVRCFVQASTDPYVAVVTTDTSSVSWSHLVTDAISAAITTALNTAV